MSEVDTITVKRDSFTDDLLNMGYTKGIKDGYNKAIDDLAEQLKKYTYGRTNGVYVEIPMYKVEELAEQLKKE